MHVVTGGAGFVGSNLARLLIARGADDVLVVDDLTDGHKFRNIADLDIADYMDRHEFLERIERDGSFVRSLNAVLHQGACSTTTEWNGEYMMQNNYNYSKTLLHRCLAAEVPLIYASSAAVYGSAKTFSEHKANELPLNVYGYSKLLFDRYVQRLSACGISTCTGRANSTKARWRASRFTLTSSSGNTAKCACSKATMAMVMASSNAILFTSMTFAM